MSVNVFLPKGSDETGFPRHWLHFISRGKSHLKDFKYLKSVELAIHTQKSFLSINDYEKVIAQVDEMLEELDIDNTGSVGLNDFLRWVSLEYLGEKKCFNNIFIHF